MTYTCQSKNCPPVRLCYTHSLPYPLIEQLPGGQGNNDAPTLQHTLALSAARLRSCRHDYRGTPPLSSALLPQQAYRAPAPAATQAAPPIPFPPSMCSHATPLLVRTRRTTDASPKRSTFSSYFTSLAKVSTIDLRVHAILLQICQEQGRNEVMLKIDWCPHPLSDEEYPPIREHVLLLNATALTLAPRGSSGLRVERGVHQDHQPVRRKVQGRRPEG